MDSLPFHDDLSLKCKGETVRIARPENWKVFRYLESLSKEDRRYI